MDFCFSVDDVCLEHYSSEDYLARLLDFLGENGVRATFAVVPLAQGVALAERREYVALLKRALAEGHEIAQHGLIHDRFQFGIPPKITATAVTERIAGHRVSGV